jgi:hypothetical protein
MRLYEDVTGDSTTINALRLSPGEEIVFANNPDLFMQLTGNKKIKVQSFLSERSFINQAQFCLIDARNNWVDSLYFSISDSLQIEHSGFLVEKIKDKLSIKELKIKKLGKLNFSDLLAKDRANKSFIAVYWWLIVLIGALLFLVIRAYRKKSSF